MSTDREAVVWTRLGGQPNRMGRLYVTDKECRFTYDDNYLQLGLPGLGLVYAPEFYGNKTISRERKQPFDLFPPIQSLIPPRNTDNFQRNLALKYLKKKHKQSFSSQDMTSFNVDWEILKVSGHGGIGHLDIFEDNNRAENWYANPPEHKLIEISDELGFSLKQFMSWFEEDIDVFIQTVGPTPSVGGAIPKLLLSIPASGWDGRIGLPSRARTPGIIDVVLKFEQSTRYPGIIELEMLAYEMHSEAGFNVPRHWPCVFKGMPALAIERFDRDQNNNPLCSETLYSILASGVPLNNHYDYRYDLIAKAIDVSPVELVSDTTKAKIHLFKRLLIALLTGNGDLHLENLSISHNNGIKEFSKIYDPAPMRAYAQHDMLSVMPFGNYGETLKDSDRPIDLKQGVTRFAKSCGLSKLQAEKTIEDMLMKTSTFNARVDELKTVPDENRKRLITRIESVRNKLSV
ncbi:MAG: HipA domain-containing protein [Gammaproteobacteria bacterium]|nr:HipA domain-containing protein [Gammaproteobacteria bacterium]